MIGGSGSGSVSLTLTYGSWRHKNTETLPLTGTQNTEWHYSTILELRPVKAGWASARTPEPQRSVLHPLLSFPSEKRNTHVNNVLMKPAKVLRIPKITKLISISKRLSVTFFSKFHDTVLVKASQKSKNTISIKWRMLPVTIHQFYPFRPISVVIRVGSGFKDFRGSGQNSTKKKKGNSMFSCLCWMFSLEGWILL